MVRKLVISVATIPEHNARKKGHLTRMNTKRSKDKKKVKILQCDRCPNTYMTVGTVPIGMAFPRPVTPDFNGEEKDQEHVCPAHPRRITQ